MVSTPSSTPRRSGSSRRTAKRGSDEAGFTLIEVMMVVLVLGILMAIATPSLVGARQRVWDLDARSSLRNTMSTAILLSEFRSDFTFASAAALATAEPTFTYVGPTEASTGPKVISVDATRPGRWAAAVMSTSGTCFAAAVEAGGEVQVESESCAAADIDADVADPVGGSAGAGDDSGGSSTPLLYVEAADAALTGGMVLSGGAVGVPENAEGFAGAPSSTNSTATFVFEVTEAGNYWIYASVASFGGSSDSFWVQVDGQPSAGYLWDTGTGVERVGDRNTSPSGVLISLQPGRHTVSLYLREDGAKVRWLELRPA